MADTPNQEDTEDDANSDPEAAITDELSSDIRDFAASIKAIAKSQPLTMSVLASMHTGLEKRHFEFLRSECEVVEETDEGIIARIPSHLLHRCSLERDELESLARAKNILPPTYVVALVSQLDFFLGRLLRWMFVAKPELLNASDRVLTFSQLTSFASISDARDSIIEKEVETFLRKSHREQFKWLEDRLATPLTKDLASWTTFIELTERRNLFVHANGRVSQHYLQTGRTEGFSVDGLQVGDALRVDHSYFSRAYRCIFEIGVKLSQVVWRKLAPDDLQKADGEFLALQYDALISREYALAEMLGEFHRKWIRKKCSDEIRRTILINEAIALDRQERGAECRQLLASDDWSSTSAKFKIAVAALENRSADVFALMDIIGPDGEIDKAAYCNWPLFARLRKDEAFLQKFGEIFDERLESAEAFKKVDSQPTDASEVITNEGMANLVEHVEDAAHQGIARS